MALVAQVGPEPRLPRVLSRVVLHGNRGVVRVDLLREEDSPPHLAVGVTLADYDNPHSLSNFTEARLDQRYSIRLTILFRQLEEPLGFVPSFSIGFEKSISNIDAFDFDRFDLGGSADVLAWSF